MTENNLQKLFNEFIEYCRYTRRLRDETIRGYKETFKHFINLMPEIISPETLSVEAINQFFKKLQDRTRTVGRGVKRTGIRDSTVKTYGSKLNSFFEWLLIKEKIIINPLKQIKLPEPVYDDKKELEENEVHKIISAINGYSDNFFILRRDLVMVYLLFFCGVRRGELLGLQVRDLDIEKRILTIRGETSKSKKTRPLPIHGTLLLHLEEYLAERKKKRYTSEYLIISTLSDRRLSRDGLRHWVKRLNKSSGVKFHLHQFRHTFACNLARNNASPIKIQLLMGHTDLRMTQRYLRSLGVEDLRDDINKLDIDNP